MKSPLAITLAQINPTVGDFAGNVDRIAAALAEAAPEGLVVFPELVLSGYHPQDLVEEPDFLARQQEALLRVLALSTRTGAALVIGAVTRNPGVGKPLHNSLLLVRAGQIVLSYDKQLLPTYDVFDERRHFEPGTDRAAIATLAGWRVGFMICEDGWNDAGRDYAANPLATLAAAGAELVVSINASPSDVGKASRREALFAAAARHRRLPLVWVNQVGGNDQLVYDGSSFAATPEDGVVARLPAFAEAVATLRFDGAFSDGAGPCVAQPALAVADPDFHAAQIVLGLRDYVGKVGFAGVVVGASGGIDSALTLALAVRALGPANVRAVTMPSPYSSRGSVDDSRALCARLGIPLHEHPIDPLFAAFRAGFAEAFAAEPSGLTCENVQARIRGTILMEYSNHFGHLVLSTGNKSELSVGYATLYGDMNGGLNLVGDLYKTEVFALARRLNEEGEIIPPAILDKPPSAELAPGQLDSDSLPPYPVLDEILKLHIEGTRLRPAEHDRARRCVAGLIADGQADLVARIHARVAGAEFKRRQAAPILRLRNRAFGNGRQMPIAARYAPGSRAASAPARPSEGGAAQDSRREAANRMHPLPREGGRGEGTPASAPARPSEGGAAQDSSREAANRMHPLPREGGRGEGTAASAPARPLEGGALPSPGRMSRSDGRGPQ